MRSRLTPLSISRWAGVGALFGLLIASSCLYHSDDVCSQGEVQDPNTGACVCPPSSVPVKRPINVVIPQGGDTALIAMCVPCGDHASVVSGACACDTGYVKGATGCVVSNLGLACTADTDCVDGDAHHCQIATGAASGYCTSTGCTSNADCNASAGYACAVSASPTFCRRAPLNEGKACTVQGVDPVCGAEAPACGFGQCFAIGCAVDSDCSPTRKCCDLSAFQPGVHACLETCI